MYKRDLITAEIQKLAEVLSRIMGLKLDGKLKDAEVLFNETMLNAFGLPKQIFEAEDLSLFEQWLSEGNLPAEKLDSLSEFLYYELGISEARNKMIAPKLNLIYQQLADQFKIVHLVNLHRQKNIQQYLS